LIRKTTIFASVALFKTDNERNRLLENIRLIYIPIKIMLLQIIVYIFIIIIVVIAFIYFKLIYPEKQVHHAFRAQVINREPFIPIFSQLHKFLQHHENDQIMLYHEELTQKYG